MSLIIPANTLASGGFNVANSARFDGANHLVRSKGASETGLTKGTFSFWVKRTNIDGGQHFLYSNTVADSSNRGYFSWRSSEKIRILSETNNASNLVLETNQLFRDPSAWYHIVYSIDTTQGTAANRCILYVNGTQVTSFSTATYMDQNSECDIFEGGQTNKEYIGGLTGDTSNLHSYLSEYVYIDGLALAADQFGEFDEDSGVWKPISVSGLTFGNNGFYLDFQTSTELGDDVSGNTNDFTEVNLTAIDQTTDTPTNNFCTLNPLDNYYSGATFSEGNLKVSSARYAGVTSTFALTQGKWYFEYKCVSRSNTSGFVGITSATATATNYEFGNQGGENVGYSVSLYNGSVYGNGGQVAASGTFAQINGGDFGMVALDFDNNKMYFGRNGTWGNSQNPENGTNALSIVAVTQGASGHWRIYVGGETGNATVFEMNFGNAPYAISSGNTDGNDRGNFEYAVPSGYLSLCSANLSESG